MTNPTPDGSSTAAAVRDRRSRAAHLLANASRRADLEWADLSNLPDWALRTSGEIDDLAWATGAWLHADALRRCIDGRLLALLRSRLGDAALAALSKASPAPATEREMPPLDLASIQPQQLDALLLASGRECLMACIEPSSVRRCLREHWWPNASAATTVPGRAAARAIVDLALAHRKPVTEEPLPPDTTP